MGGVACAQVCRSTCRWPEGVLARERDTVRSFVGLLGSLCAMRAVYAVQAIGAFPTSSPLVPVINSVNTAFLTNTTSFVSSPNATETGQWTGGTWSRVVGGAVDSNSKTTSTVMPGFDVGQLNGPNSPHTFASGSQKCIQFTGQDYMGFQVGTDLGQLNIGNKGGNWHFGVTAGALYLNTQDKTPQSERANGGSGFTRQRPGI